MADSIYYFNFVYTLKGTSLGDHYTGFVIAETGTYTAGQTFWGHVVAGKYDGYYQIIQENRTNVELSDYYGASHEDGMVYASHYWDAKLGKYNETYKYVPTDVYGKILAFGINYLGSEYGYASTSDGLIDFGLNSTRTLLDASLYV